MTRRDFLAAALLTPAAAAGTPAMMPIVDTHQHLWDLSQFTMPWIKRGEEPLGKSHTPKEYAEATAGLNIVKAVYMEVGMPVAEQQAEAEFVIELCKNGRTPTCAGVVAGNPASDGFEKYVRQFHKSPYIKGIRHMLHVEGVKASDGLTPAFLKGLTLLGELGMRFDLCIRPQEITTIEKIIAAVPGTQFVLDHCGNPQAKFTSAETAAWKAGLKAIAKHPNVVCKVSGIVANGFQKGVWKAKDLAPFVNVVLDTFGPDRVMFASDWPVCTRAATLAEWVNALREIVAPRPEAEQRKLFHDNAIKFYELT